MDVHSNMYEIVDRWTEYEKLHIRFKYYFFIQSIVMEKRFKECLISMRKISNLTEHSRICTFQGDVDEFNSSAWFGIVTRAIWHSREKALEVVQSKYNDLREHSQYIMESNQLTEYLPLFRNALQKSKIGLTLYKSNERYRNDNVIRSTIDHLLEEEIPSHIASITTWLEQCKN